MGEQIIQTAKEYIRKNTVFYTEDGYEWIRSIIDNVLDDSITQEGIQSFIDSIIPVLSKQVNKTASSEISAEITGVDKQILNERISISKLVSINEIHNVGILDRSDPIILPDSLIPTVFYGRNGTGKSSLYLGLCKALGRGDKTVFRNIKKQNSPLKCIVKAIDRDGIERELVYDEEENFAKATDVKIFDSDISTRILKQPQTNNFKIARLEIEYFTKLDSIIKNLESKILDRKSSYHDRVDVLRELIGEKIINLLDQDSSITKESISDVKFSRKDKEDLKQLETGLEELSKGSQELLIKRLNRTISDLMDISKQFGAFTDFSKVDIESTYTKEYFNEINDSIRNYYKVIELIKHQKLGKFISKEWIDSSEWQEFISRSIDFVEHLENHQQTKYTKETCPYCLQNLLDEDSKDLLIAYKELRKSSENNLQNVKTKLKEYLDDCELIQSELNKTKLSSENIKEDLKLINIESVPEFNDLSGFVKDLIYAIANKEEFTSIDSLVENINSYLEFISNAIINLDKKVKELELLEKNRTNPLKKLEDEIDKLRLKQEMFNQKNNILELFENQRIVELINDFKRKFRNLKTQLSSAQTRFERDSKLQTFEKFVKKEYDFLNFEPPREWNISAQTSGSVTERVYNLGDKELQDIFSEGEQKLHALSDFFAFSEITNFKGVFIFDDPVTSLDQDNIERVADRIKLLIDKGNQVIVFTHNILFLNFLVDSEREEVFILNKYGTEVDIKQDKVTNHFLSQTFDEIMKKTEALEKLNRESPKDVSKYDIKCVYDMIRGYLEDYFEEKAMKGVMVRYHPLIRMTKIASIGDLSKEKLRKLSELHFKVNRKINSHSQPIGSPTPEINELMKFFYEIKKDYTPSSKLSS